MHKHKHSDSISEIVQGKKQSQQKALIKKKGSEDTTLSASTSLSSSGNLPISMQFLGLDINDIFEFGEYIETIIKSIRSTHLDISSISLNFWDFYFKSNLNNNISSLLLYFDKDLSSLSDYFFKTLLISVIIAYDSSFNDTLIRSVYKYLNKCMIQLHRVYLVICDYLIHHIKINEDLKAQMIQNLKLKLAITNPNYTVELKNVMKSVLSVLNKMMVKKYQNTPLGTELLSFCENIHTISVNDIDLFFQGEVNRVNQTKSNKQIEQASYIPLSLIKCSAVNMFKSPNFIPPPFQSTASNNRKYYTLVLDMDETLIHFVVDNESEGRLLYRPYLFEFLNQVSHLFEVVVYTASVKEYADIILNLIETKIGHKVFDYRLYREHTTLDNGSFIKDLSRLGRDLSRVVIVDNLAKTFEYQKANGILISSFIGQNKNDRCLLDLGDILSEISQSKSSNDIRDLLKLFRQEIKAKVSLCSK